MERTSSGQVWFDDVTEGSGLTHERVAEEADATLADRMMAGVCAIDLDGVAPLDLFFTGRRTGTRLYRASGPWRYDDVTSRLDLSGVDALGCLAVDLDGDRRDELIVSASGGVYLFANEGDHFTRTPLVTSAPTWLYASVAAGDLDADGDLDLVLAGFADQASAPTTDCAPLPCGARLERMRGIPNVLLVREGEDFVDRTAELAPDLMNSEPTLVVTIVDLDGDGANEIVVSNDLGSQFSDRVLAREGSGFVDRGRDWGLSTNGRGFGVDSMGIAFGDVDGSGTLDVATTDFSGSTSALFFCDADRYCSDRARSVGLLRTEESFRWGNALVDLDRDGDLELFEATGHVYSEEEASAWGATIHRAQRPNLYEGTEGLFLRVVPEPGSALFWTYQARGLTVLDADDDGALDIVLSTTRGAPALLRNVRTEGHWLRVVLEGRAPNTDAVGARVELVTASGTQVRVRLAGEGYLGSFDPRLHFGSSSAEPAILRVHWPDGVTTEHPVDGWDRELRLTQPD